MAKSKSELPPVRNFRDAFCRAHRCRPDDFERKVFWKTLYRRAYFPVLFTGGLDGELFQHDLETIRAIGEASTLEEVERLLEDLTSLGHVERSFRRRVLRFRISRTRVAALLKGLDALIEAPARVEGGAPMPATAAATMTPPPVVVFPAVSGGEANVGVLRKLKRSHELITQGKPLSEIFSELRFTEADFQAALSNHASSRPEFSWLKSYFLERRELEKLRAENARLRDAVADSGVRGELRVLGDGHY